MTDTAIAKRELPREISLVLRETAMSEDVVRAALMSAYRDCPAPEVARALVKCARHDLDPLGDHVVVFKPKGSEKWAVYLTLKAYEEIASRHPDFGALTYTDFQESENEVRIGCFVHRKSFPTPSGPFWGRAQKFGQRSKAKGGGQYKVDWPWEIAQSRARRAALRATLGLNIPDDDFDDGSIKMRDDQRRRLFSLAARVGWDDDERHRQATIVLGRDVESWATLTEEEATRLEIAWQSLEDAIDVDPETGEILNHQESPGAPAQGPIEDAGAPSDPKPSPERSSDDVAPAPAAPPKATHASAVGEARGRADAAAEALPGASSEVADPDVGDQGRDPAASSARDLWDDEDEREYMGTAEERDIAVTRAKAALDAMYGDSISRPARAARVNAFIAACGKNRVDDLTLAELTELAQQTEAQLGAPL